MTKRVPYIVGDIHGCFDELIALEKMIKEHSAANRWLPLLVSVGDLIDRGQNSNQVINRFQEGQIRGTHSCILGNHEADFLRLIEAFNPTLLPKLNPAIFSIKEDFLQKRRGAEFYTNEEEFQQASLVSWLEQGGFETLASYQIKSHDPSTWNLPVDAISFLNNLPIIWANNDYVVTHALASSAQLKAALSGPLLQKSDDFLFKESCFALMWNRNHPENHPDPHRVHLSGHSPLAEVFASKKFKFIQIDTGCVYGGELTAFCCANQELLAAPMQNKAFSRHPHTLVKKKPDL